MVERVRSTEIVQSVPRERPVTARLRRKNPPDKRCTGPAARRIRPAACVPQRLLTNRSAEAKDRSSVKLTSQKNVTTVAPHFRG